MTDSIYQKNIYSFVKNGKGNAVINAKAGSGKTTTIVKSLEFIPAGNSALFCAFSNLIVKSIKDKINTEKNIEVTTLHSLGWRYLMKHNNYKVKLSPNRLFGIAEKLYKEKKKGRAYFYQLKKLVDLMKQNVVFDFDSIFELADKHMINVSAEEILEAIQLFEASIKNQKEFDFTDMIFQPAVRESIQLPKFDFVFVDEAQDLNIAQQMLLKRVLKPKGRLIAVGDENQAIYGFAGSDIEAFNKFRAMPNTIELPLTMSFRCPKNVVKRAQTIVPSIEAFDKNIDGVNSVGTIDQLRDGDWVLCRNVKPLIRLCVMLLKQGKKATVRGRDIGTSIIYLLQTTNASSPRVAVVKLEAQRKKLIQTLTTWGMKEPKNNWKVQDMGEKIEIINFLSKECLTIKSMLLKLNKIFDDKSTTGIILSTIHKSKGLEADRVFILLPGLIPSKFATQEWQLVQEDNLLYVAITRSRKELYDINEF